MFSESIMRKWKSTRVAYLNYLKMAETSVAVPPVKARFLAQEHINGLVERKTGLRCRVTEALIPAGLTIC